MENMTAKEKKLVLSLKVHLARLTLDWTEANIEAGTGLRGAQIVATAVGAFAGSLVTIGAKDHDMDTRATLLRAMELENERLLLGRATGDGAPRDPARDPTS